MDSSPPWEDLSFFMTANSRWLCWEVTMIINTVISFSSFPLISCQDNPLANSNQKPGTTGTQWWNSCQSASWRREQIGEKYGISMEWHMEVIQLSPSESRDWVYYFSFYSPEHLSQITWCIHCIPTTYTCKVYYLSQNSWAEHKVDTSHICRRTS